jgi:AcrR family transcriptional regulator
MTEIRGTSSTRDRLLLAGAHLLEESRGGEVSTRAILELAGVQAPTLYHHFESKQGLLDAVVSHGFRQFLKVRTSLGAPSEDPIADIREGWDRHVLFGLEHPNFYAHVYGNVRPGEPCGVIAEVEAMVLEALQPAARQGRLAVPPATAAKEIVAASSGVILTLIQQRPDERDLDLSRRVREAILRSLVPDSEPLDARAGSQSPAAAAVALSSMLGETASPLNDAETALLRDWLDRLVAASSGASGKPRA